MVCCLGEQTTKLEVMTWQTKLKIKLHSIAILCRNLIKILWIEETLYEPTPIIYSCCYLAMVISLVKVNLLGEILKSVKNL